jgi:trehalose-6-phosphatase
MPIYIGDDVADEDAFAELNQVRVRVRVRVTVTVTVRVS